MNLKGEFHNIKKGAYSVDLYLQKIKVVRDKLLAVGVIVDDEDCFTSLLKDFPRSTMPLGQLYKPRVLM